MRKLKQDNCITSGGIPRRNGIYYCPFLNSDPDSNSDSGCSYSSKAKVAVQAHIEFRHSDAKPFSCLLCEFRCKSESALRAHIRVHTGEKPFACKISGCSYASNQSGHLLEHQNTVHSTSRDFPCDFPSCQFKFSTKSRLQSHQKIHETVQNRKHICPHPNCEYEAKRREHLNNHIACLHSDERPFKCPLTWPSGSGGGTGKCGYAGKTKEGLKLHLKIHDKDDTRKKSCTFPGCDYKTRQKGHLNEHLRRHLGTEKKYKCGSCPRFFTGKTGLAHHVRSEHSRDKEDWFSCSFCEYKSAGFQSLSTHMRKHTKEAPYKCAVCNKSGYHTTFLHDHKRLHERQSQSQNQNAHQKDEHQELQKESSSALKLCVYECPSIKTDAKIKTKVKVKVSCSFSTTHIKEMALHLNGVHKLPRIKLVRL